MVPVFQLPRVTPVTEEALGKAMLAMARREGHRASTYSERSAPKVTDKMVQVLRLIDGGAVLASQIGPALGISPQAASNRIMQMRELGAVEIAGNRLTGSRKAKIHVYALTDAGRALVQGGAE
jgi:DNA-binding transcriptional ArsR family regulator